MPYTGLHVARVITPTGPGSPSPSSTLVTGVPSWLQHVWMTRTPPLVAGPADRHTQQVVRRGGTRSMHCGRVMRMPTPVGGNRTPVIAQPVQATRTPSGGWRRGDGHHSTHQGW